MPLSTGQVVRDRYRIEASLGHGGMGAVYCARDMSLDIPVAIKENLDTSREAQQQFEREARILARLSHPSLPRVTDHFFIPGHGQYLVMDYVEGEDLETMLERLGRLPESQVLEWVMQICDALAYLHSQPSPVIHRDIKPGNIKIRSDGKAMLVDFGIAKVYDPHLATTMGAKAVTPGYSPPEQYGMGATDARSDIYALGATIYHLLTGEVPLESVQRLVEPSRVLAPRQVNQQISPGMEQVILKAVDVATERRYQSVTELRQALTAPVGGAHSRTKLLPQAERAAGLPPLPADHDRRLPESAASFVEQQGRAKKKSSLYAIGGGVLALVVIAILLPIVLRKPSIPGGATSTPGASVRPDDQQGALSGQVVKIALLGPIGGEDGTFGRSMLDGATLAVETWNERGGVLGAQVELITRDTEGDGEKAASVAAEVIDREGVSFIVGDLVSHSSIPISEVAADRGIVHIAPTSTNPRVTVDEDGNVKDTVFRACFTDPFQGRVAAKFALDELGVRNGAFLYDPGNDYVRGLAESFSQEFQSGGGTIAAAETYNGETQGFAPQLRRVKEAGAEVLYLPDYYSTVNRIAAQAREMGLGAVLVGGDGWDSPDLDRGVLDGSYYTNHFSPDDPRSVTQVFVESYRAGYGVEPDAIAALSYDAIDLVLRAVEASASMEPDQIARTLEAAEFELVTGDLRFDAQHNPIKSVPVFQVLDGAVSYTTTVRDLAGVDGSASILTEPETPDIPSFARRLLSTDPNEASLVILAEEDFSELPADRWAVYADASDVTVANGTFTLSGRADWASSVGYHPKLSEGQALLVTLSSTQESRFEMYLSTGDWNQPTYKRWGIYGDPELRMNLYDGLETQYASPDFNGGFSPEPGHWYSLLLGIGCNGRFTASVWDQASPDTGAVYEQVFSDRWQGQTWGFIVAADQGDVILDTVTVVSFATCGDVEAGELTNALLDACIAQAYSEVVSPRIVYVDDREDPAPTPGYASYDYEGIYLSETGSIADDDERISELGANSDPVWSPDGASIAYIHATDDNLNHVILRDFLTGESRDIRGGFIAGRLSGLSWSPDGSKLALENWDWASGKSGLVVLDIASGQVGLVVRNDSNGYSEFSNISWSPCGDRIAYHARIGSDVNDADGWVWRIVDVDGSETVEIMTADDGLGVWGPLLWSADGRQITFNAFEVNTDGVTGSPELWTAAVDGSDSHRLDEPLLVVDQSHYPWLRLLTP